MLFVNTCVVLYGLLMFSSCGYACVCGRVLLWFKMRLCVSWVICRVLLHTLIFGFSVIVCACVQ